MKLKLFAVATAARLVLMIGSLPAQAPKTTTVNLADYYQKCAPAGQTTPTYCLAGIHQALADAKSFFTANPAGNYVIQLNPELIDLTPEFPAQANFGYFNFTNFPAHTGTLTLQGTAGMTIVITNNGFNTIYGTEVSHVHIEGITFRRNDMTVTQGRYTGTFLDKQGLRNVQIMIPEGFPLPTRTTPFGPPREDLGLLRVYDNTNPLDPRIIPDAKNAQLYFNYSLTTCDPPTGYQGTLCTLRLAPGNKELTSYFDVTNNNYLIGIKIEINGDAVTLDGQSPAGPGTDVVFLNDDWYDAARMELTNLSNIQIIGNNILRREALRRGVFDPVGGFQAPAMSTAEGGPQIGNPLQPGFAVSGLLIRDFTAIGTGDDSIAIFYQGGTTPSVVENTNITSSFARTINLDHSCSVHFRRNVGNQCTQLPEWGYPAGYQYCISDTTRTPTNPPVSTPCAVVQQ